MNQRIISELKNEATIRRIELPTKKQRLLTVARMFATRQDDAFTAICDVEFKLDNVIRAIGSNGTVLEPIVALLNRLNISTEPNALAVRKSLSLTNPEFHELVCACRGRIVAGSVLRERFEQLALRS